MQLMQRFSKATTKPADPQADVCPISREPISSLKNPFKASDGHTYESNDLYKWLKQSPNNPTSPLTRAPMGDDLNALKSARGRRLDQRERASANKLNIALALLAAQFTSVGLVAGVLSHSGLPQGVSYLQAAVLGSVFVTASTYAATINYATAKKKYIDHWAAAFKFHGYELTDDANCTQEDATAFVSAQTAKIPWYIRPECPKNPFTEAQAV